MTDYCGKRHHFYKHGHCQQGQRTKEWRAWNAMIRRCRYPSMDDYERYGGRGITVCQRWLDSFLHFWEDVGPAPSSKHSLDRIDNDGNYEPGNVRWATASEQIKNSRRARWIEFKGKVQTMGEWAEELGMNRQTLQMRLDYYGWSVEKTFTLPVQQPGPGSAKKCEFRGESKTISEWSKELGIARSTLYKRINKLSWSIERALTTPT